MKYPLYKEPMEWAKGVEYLLDSLKDEYEAVEERVEYLFETVEGEKGLECIKPEDYVGLIFWQTERSTGRKYKFTITRESV